LYLKTIHAIYADYWGIFTAVYADRMRNSWLVKPTLNVVGSYLGTLPLVLIQQLDRQQEKNHYNH